MKCRHCDTRLDLPGHENVFLDLGSAPPSNAFLRTEQLSEPERYFPLKLFTCPNCLLVQVDEMQSHTDLFAPDYVYFSSYSRSWVEHAERYVDKVVSRLKLDASSMVMEIASNDGYLLQFMSSRGIPCFGIEPTAGTASAAQAKGIETLVEFFEPEFARRLATERGRVDLLIANNVLAHVPDLNGFVSGIARMLKPQGCATIEFPHLQRLIEGRQFDTVYHEHFSYFSLHTARTVFSAYGLRIWDVEELTTHGGSLRVWACPEAGAPAETERMTALLKEEVRAGMLETSYYRDFQSKADAIKNGLLEFLLEARREGSKVIGYGAAAKGNTLLNYAGVRPDLLPFVIDASPHKQGRYLPGSRIPVVAEDILRRERPEIILVLPWNLREEIAGQLSYVREWSGRFAVAVPAIELF